MRGVLKKKNPTYYHVVKNPGRTIAPSFPNGACIMFAVCQGYITRVYSGGYLK